MIGATLGFSYLMNTILFTNLTFIIDRVPSIGGLCVLLCGLLALSAAVLYRPLRKELVRVRWIRRCCCPSEGRLKSYRIHLGDETKDDGELGDL